jgi:hypothetical protein
LIYNEIFSSFSSYNKSHYWWGIGALWIMGLVVLGSATLYFDLLFAGKGYAYQQGWIELLMVLYTVELILRIGGLQTLLLVLKTREYLRWNSFGMLLQLGILVVLLLLGRYTQDLMQLLWVLVICEFVLLVLFYGGFKRFQCHAES